MSKEFDGNSSYMSVPGKGTFKFDETPRSIGWDCGGWVKDLDGSITRVPGKPPKEVKYSNEDLQHFKESEVEMNQPKTRQELHRGIEELIREGIDSSEDCGCGCVLTWQSFISEKILRLLEKNGWRQ